MGVFSFTGLKNPHDLFIIQNGEKQRAQEDQRLVMEGAPSDPEIFAHCKALPEEEKDYEPFDSMLKLIKKFDGLRIYRLDR